MTSLPRSTAPRRIIRRTGYLVVGLAALGAGIAEAVHGGPLAISAVVLFALGPDVTMLVGARDTTEQGQLSRRAVPYYNAAHRLIGPIVLTVAGALAGPPALLAAGLTWLAHITIDRACGYGLRDVHGWQRDR